MGNVSAGDMTAMADQTGTVNSFDVVDKFPDPTQAGGCGNDQITLRSDSKNSDITTHEVSHALGNAHLEQGGTLPSKGGDKVGKNNIGETLKGVGIGGNNISRNLNGTASDITVKSTGDGRLLNGSTNVGLESGKVISQNRYERIMKRLGNN